MKLDDFLKCKKVRCVNKAYDGCLEIGKEYNVIDIGVEIKVKDDRGDLLYWESDYFEPVLDAAENPPQKMELTPEFDAVEPKFKVGDKVYCLLLEPKIFTILEVDGDNDNDVQFAGEFGWASGYSCCHANQENYERLQAIFPRIEFEQPPTQEDIDNEAVDKLAQAMKNKLAKKREQGYKGWETCKHGDLVQLLINHVDKGDPIDVANFCAFLFARGESLTGGDAR